jgi:hypothetical protein
VELSISELKAFADLVGKIAEPSRPQRGVYANYLKPSRRRGWINR